MATRSFLDIIARDPVASSPDGDQYGGAAGAHGSGLPTGDARPSGASHVGHAAPAVPRRGALLRRRS